MKVPSKEEIKTFLKTHRSEWSREKVAEGIGVEKSTLDKCLSTREMSDSMRFDIAKLVGMIKVDSFPALPSPKMGFVIEPTKEEYTRWNKCALKEGKLVEEWCIDELNARAEMLLSKEFNITSLPVQSLVAEEAAVYNPALKELEQTGGESKAENAQ